MLAGKSFRRRYGLRSVVTSLLIIAFHVHATSVVAPRFETLVDRAELIFTGQVIGQRCEWRDQQGQRSIVTLVTFAVRKVHKGRADSTITLQFLGGKIGDVTLDVTDIPRFRIGERVVLFTAGNGAAVSPVIGFFHGRFSLRKDEAGREAVFTHDNEPVADVAELGRSKHLSESSRHALSHEEFSAKIRERLGATGVK